MLNCPECNGEVKQRGNDFVCEECGLVLDRPHEIFHSSGKKSESLGSVVDGAGAEDWENVPWRRRGQYKRLKDLQEGTTPGKRRKLKKKLDRLKTVCSGKDIPDYVLEYAEDLVVKADEQNLFKGRSIEDVINAIIYATYKQHGIPKTLYEICTYSKHSYKEAKKYEKRIRRTYFFLKKELKLTTKPMKPQDYVSKFCSELGLNLEVQKKAIEILDMAKEKELPFRLPNGTAGAAIYIAATLYNEKPSQERIAKVSGVTEVTIRNRYKELVEKLGVKVPI